MIEQLMEQAVREGKAVLLDFNAPWCSTCQAVDELLDNALPRLENRLVLIKVDIHREPQLAEQFNILSVPTVILLNAQGQVVWRRSSLFRLGELDKALVGEPRG